LNRKKVSQFPKWSFIIVSDAFLILSAFYCCYLNNVKNDPQHFSHFVTGEKQEWIGEVKDLPVEKEKFFKVLMEVKSLDGNEIANGKVVVYLKKPFEDSNLQPGSFLKLNSAFISPKLPLNPYEFNYKEFLGRKTIYFQTFVEPQNFELIKANTGFSLVNLGLKIKQKIINTLETSSLNKETAQLCIALLTGYDDEINSETINAFAHSGTLHVLSVSGLHTGILYAVLIFILGLVDKNKKFKFIQLAVIGISLWFFALITGFSPPVLRAVIMLNLIAIGRSYYSYSSQNSVNILAVSAFLILVFDPLLIYDTGFLLSYMAVLGILYFEPGITALVNSRFTLVNKIWQLTSVSLSAQITTLPITLFLFHQFPFWFIFSNLIVIPLCTVVMFLAFLLLLKLNVIAPLINVCSAIIFKCIHLTDERGFGYADLIDFGWSDFVFLTTFTLVIAAFIKHRTYVYIAGAAAVMIVWQLISLFEIADKKSDSHLAIYHVNKQSVTDIKNTTQLHFNSSSGESDYNYHVKPNHTFYNYCDINNLKFDYVRSVNSSFFRLNSADQQALIPFLKPDYIIVSENVGFTEEFFPKSAKLIIADGSNNYKHVKELKALCDKFAIAFYSTAESGYLQLGL
jgi:competence protein ComEC